MARFLIIFVGVATAPALAAVARAEPEDAVVRIAASTRLPHPAQPWARPQPAQTFGTGVVVEGKRILTNAHVVAYGTGITVEDRRGGEKLEAKVVAINFDVDLALLSVGEDKFFDKRPPLPRTPQLPRVQDTVSLYGFPIGGNDLSVAKGQVSRIEYTGYGRAVGPVIQVSAPVNPGNSGGPAVVDGKMVGVVVSRVQNAQNIGSVIPNEEVDAFLESARQGKPAGKPSLATRFLFQNLENKALRRRFGIDAGVRGVLVQVPAAEENKSPLKQFDVLTRIGEYDLDNQGNVRLKTGARAPYLYLVPQLARDGAVPVTVWRQGKELTLSLPATARDDRLLRSYQGEPLPYFVHGPLVFVPARSEDVTIYAQMNRTFYIDNSPLVTRADETARFPGEELVVVSSRLLAHPIAKGYMDPVGKTVKDVNGTAIKNLAHLVEVLRDTKDEFVTIRFVDNYSEVLVFDRQELAKATDEILEDHGIPVSRRGSPEMLKVWKGGAGK